MPFMYSASVDFQYIYRVVEVLREESYPYSTVMSRDIYIESQFTVLINVELQTAEIKLFPPPDSTKTGSCGEK